MASHRHHSHELNEAGDKGLLFSVPMNTDLIVIPIIGGILSGSRDRDFHVAHSTIGMETPRSRCES